jgi:hypothetical protein
MLPLQFLFIILLSAGVFLSSKLLSMKRISYQDHSRAKVQYNDTPVKPDMDEVSVRPRKPSPRLRNDIPRDTYVTRSTFNAQESISIRAALCYFH